MKLIQFCKDKQIELIGLYPNATHLIQPLDASLFHVLKDKYKEANDAWRIEHNIVDVKKHMFAEILKKALDSYDFSNCIKHGFKACGLVPFNPDAVQYNILNKKKKTKEDLSNNKDETDVSVNLTSTSETLLSKFEKDLLSPEVMEAFKRDELKESWTGDIKLEGLFEYWKKLRNSSGKWII